MADEALNIFIFYSHRDETLKDELVNLHLKPLKREEKINTWQDRNIEVGTEWAEEIRTNLEKADIVLLLITRHFLASDYCYETEMQRAVQRHHEGTTKVIPIILETCGWKYSDFKHLQVLPKDGKPVTSWDNQADAFFDVEEGIRRVVDVLNAERRQTEEAERARVAAELQPRREAEGLHQEREAAAKLGQERQATEQPRREQEAEQLKREAEAERQRQQKLEAERREQERQKREAAERQRQQQAEAEARERERQKQLDAERQRQQEAAAAGRQRQTGIGRRRAIQIAGLGGGGLFLVLMTNSLLSENPSSDSDSGHSPESAEVPGSGELPIVSGTSPDDLSVVEVQTVKVGATGTIAEHLQGQVNAFREDLGNGIGLDMVEIPAGEFVMGSPTEEEGRSDDEGPQLTVSVPGFFMGRFQVTQAQYEAVMGENPSNFKSANRPVEKISWNDAVAFCEKLSQQTGRTYRLPSEAEWEYACRAGTTTPFHFGPTITTDLANYRGTDKKYDKYEAIKYERKTIPGNYGKGPKGVFRKKTTKVGTFPPNAFGLHDMHGNVWEWCQDVWHDNYEGAPTDGSAWIEGGTQEGRVMRGGSWSFNPEDCRLANRNWDTPLGTGITLGFRVVCGGA